MNNIWRNVKVGDVCELVVDCVNKTAPLSEIETPYKMIRTSHIKNGFIKLSDYKFVDEDTYKKWTRRAILQKGDVLLTREAPLGSVAIIRDEKNHFLGQRIMQYRANPDLLVPEFLLYAFLSPRLQAQFHSYGGTGSTVDHIRVPDCKNFEIPLPPLKQQKGIAEILDTIDKKIELNRKNNETLEKIAKALFKSWFIDFDHVKAKAEGRSTGLPNEIGELFPDSFEDSEIGEIPSGWSLFKLKDFISLDSGLPYKGKLKGEGEGYLLTMGCADKYLRFKSKGVYKYPLDIPEKHIVKPGNIVVCSHDLTQARDQLGQPFIVPTTYEGKVTAASTNTFIVRSKQENKAEFLYQVFRCKRFREQMIASAKGSVILHISKDAILDYDFVAPPSDEVFLSYQKLTSPIVNMMNKNLRNSQTLAEVREFLLPKLISGDLRIPDAEKMIEEIGI